MADSKVIQEWLQKADDDFDFAVSVLEDTTFYGQICFHFQQAAEKYLKAVIVADDLEFKKIHDLIALIKLCSKSRPDLEDLIPHCRFLNPFYIDTRYPVHWPTNYTRESARQAQKAAETIRNTIKSSLVNK